MGKLDVNKKRKMESLLNTSFDLFIQQGINKTTISDIVKRAGVAKGTFYLYFKDKYDIRNKLIAHKSSLLFEKAFHAMETVYPGKKRSFEDSVIFIVNHILDQLVEDKSLLLFISKNLGWGVFKHALTAYPEDTYDFPDLLSLVTADEGLNSAQAELMLYMIVELTSSTCYSAILYNEPVPINELKPHLFEAIRSIIKNQKKQAQKENE